MRKVLVIICAIGFLTPAFAQRYKYKELAPLLDSVSQTSQVSLLMEYISEEPNHANANFRLALAHYDMYRNADPLLQFQSKMAHAKEATLRLLRAKLLVTQQDVRSDNEYYAPFFKTTDSKGKPYVDFSVVQKKLVDAYDSSQAALVKLPPIYLAFTKSVDQYNNAVKLFAQINNDYKSMEDLYMLYDENLEGRLKQLKTHYDSTLFYFNHFLDLKKDYPLRRYNQKYHVNPIHVYRLDGLVSRLSFLASDVEFWNYGAWVDNVIKVHATEIADLKKKIEQNEAKISDAIKSIEGGNTSTKLQSVDKDVIFKLNNFDKNSLALALLEYKMYKQEWALRSKSIGVDSTLAIKLPLYSDLIQINRKADSLFLRAKGDVNSVSLKKHADFLAKHYGGESGLQEYLASEQSFIENTFQHYQDTLKRNLVKVNGTNLSSGKTLKIGAYTVSMDIQEKPVLPLTAAAIFTLKQTKNPDGSMYLGGIHNLNKKQPTLVAFVARINPDGKSAWLKEFVFPIDSAGPLNTDNFISEMVATQEGCAALIRSIRTTDQVAKNSFVYLTADKGEGRVIHLTHGEMPRKLHYQEASNTFVMAFKGKEDLQQFENPENISITSINVLGDLLWNRDIQLAGTMQDLIPLKDGFLLAGNFSMIQNSNGKEIRTKINQSQSNPYLIKLSTRGEILKVMPIETPKSIFIDRIVKVNDGSINLIGVESTFAEAVNKTSLPGNVMHLMTRSDLVKICSNF
jgi:hypothetical protein